jgi:hypothetical protein
VAVVVAAAQAGVHPLLADLARVVCDRRHSDRLVAVDDGVVDGGQHGGELADRLGTHRSTRCMCDRTQ